ncbi:NAD(P)-dependent oxidoreductase [Rouxiella chamberiensis]|nr:NAD(P)-dependent oxidoreductase [Rouxiella chamberiensis]
MNNVTRITLIGLGEVGTILATDLKKLNPALDVVAFDKQTGSAVIRQRARAAGVSFASSAEDVVKDRQIIFSAVTAAEALNVAEAVAGHLAPGQFFLDLNSVSPHTKHEAMALIEQAGGNYIDVAVMAPYPPARLKTPLLLGGTQAYAISEWLNENGFNSKVHSTTVGEASAIKMCRSVMIKGLEALTAECLSAARQYGVEKEVLASLHASFPSLGWNAQLPHYLISRIAEHGKRRAEEMREVVKTLADVGVAPNMSSGTVLAQQELVDSLAEKGIRYSDLEPFEWERTVDLLMSGRTS